jgi:hypothetical protein
MIALPIDTGALSPCEHPVGLDGTLALRVHDVIPWLDPIFLASFNQQLGR